MQQRAGLLFLSKVTGRILLILENQTWTVPTFDRSASLLEDADQTLITFCRGKIIPVELYHSRDKGFEYGTYVCLVKDEFLSSTPQTLAWCCLDCLPKGLHTGLKLTLNNVVVRAKIETILELETYAESI